MSEYALFGRCELQRPPNFFGFKPTTKLDNFWSDPNFRAWIISRGGESMSMGLRWLPPSVRV